MIVSDVEEHETAHQSQLNAALHPYFLMNAVSWRKV